MMMGGKIPPVVFTWHIHGTYLYYLSLGNFIIYVPVNDQRSNRNIGRGNTFPFGNNVIEVPVDDIPNLHFDCILFQTEENYTSDQYDILTEEQRRLPRIYLEHNPPQQHPTDTLHVVDDPEVLVVHVTHFNRLMWDNRDNETVVIQHGVRDPGVKYDGSLEKGIVIINNLSDRGRRLGLDIFQKVSKEVPLDLIGMGNEKIGLGEVLHPQLPAFISRYRFFFNPIRYTSFGLAVCEAMMVGLPVVGMATTEMPGVFVNGVNGIISNDITYLIDEMKKLLGNKRHAASIGEKGRSTVTSQFNIHKFTDQWMQVLSRMIKKRSYEEADSLHQ